jgi:toxin HigB-1
MLEISTSVKARKQLEKAPLLIREKFALWALRLQQEGLPYVQQTYKGYHDEPLQGKRQGQCSVRLNQQWRLIYSLNAQQQVTLLCIEEVTPHDYRTR